jgi:FkbM family methyltransferase
MRAKVVGPSRSGPLGTAARRIIDTSPFVRTIVKSETGQRLVQALRAAPHIQTSGRFLLRSLVAPGRASLYAVRGTTTQVVLRHRTNDVLAFNEVFHRQAYDLPLEVAERLRNISRPLHVVDLGANIGLFSAWVVARMPVAEIDAYEPDSQNARILRRMVAANTAKNRIRVHEACAGVSTGVVRFIAGDFIHSRVVETEDINAIELPQEDVMPTLEHADVIKIDIEGSEWPILADDRWPRTKALAVAMEWHVTDTVSDGEARATAALERAGLNVVHRYSEEPSCGILWAVRRADQ